MATLTDHIKNAWQDLRDSVRNEDWTATQRGFQRMETLQHVNEESAKKFQELEPIPDHSLNQDDPVAELLNGVRRGTIRPKELRIGSERIPIAINNQIVVATGNWILKKGKAIPVLRNFVHRDNTGFSPSAKTKKLEDGSFVEIGDSQSTLVSKARKLLDVCGFRDSKIEVHLEDGSVIDG